jgi:hypothetical protein
LLGFLIARSTASRFSISVCAAVVVKLNDYGDEGTIPTPNGPHANLVVRLAVTTRPMPATALNE